MFDKIKHKFWKIIYDRLDYKLNKEGYLDGAEYNLYEKAKYAVAYNPDSNKE